MKSLAQEIEGFSKGHLRKQITRVTTVTGRKLIETRSGENFQIADDSEQDGDEACGFVQDLRLDLQVGTIRPFLLLCEFTQRRSLVILTSLRLIDSRYKYYVYEHDDPASDMSLKSIEYHDT